MRKPLVGDQKEPQKLIKPNDLFSCALLEWHMWSGDFERKKSRGFKGGGRPPSPEKKKKTISKFINYYAQKLTCKHKVALTVAVERYLPTTALFNFLTMEVCLECWGEGGPRAGCALEDRDTKRSNQYLAFFPLDTRDFTTHYERHYICPQIPKRATTECKHSNLLSKAAMARKISCFDFIKNSLPLKGNHKLTNFTLREIIFKGRWRQLKIDCNKSCGVDPADIPDSQKHLIFHKKMCLQ